jgi:RNA polymerase sigma-70 factor (ECF subfamily)
VLAVNVATGPAPEKPGDRLGETPETLLEGVQKDDPAKWSRMVCLYTPLVLWWCHRRGLCHDAAEDVLQEVFTTVWGKVKGFQKDGQPGAFRRWLFTITRYKLLRKWQQEQYKPRLVGGPRPDEYPDPTPPYDSSDEDDATAQRLVVRRAWELIRGEFEPRTWDAAWQVIVEGRSPQDVATAAGLTVGAVYTYKSRVLKRLREDLEASGEFPT